LWKTPVQPFVLADYLKDGKMPGRNVFGGPNDVRCLSQCPKQIQPARLVLEGLSDRN
jgi:hypothetical protein